MSDARHTCHWPGCREIVPPKLWGCRPHWYTLPARLRDRIWAAYRPGQEIDKKPSEAYIAVAREAQEWCLAHIATASPAPQRDLFETAGPTP